MFDDNEDWESAEETRKETSGGTWIRLEDGEKALVVFPVPPFDYRQVFNEKEKRSEIYDPDKHDGQRPSGRFAFPVFTPLAGSHEYEPKIFDASGETFDAIKAARKKYGAKYLYEITRKGSGTKTKYQVLPERELKPKEVAYLKTLELLDAKALTLGEGGTNETKPSAPPAEDPWGDE